MVDKLLFRFSICESVPEIFAIKVESCQKSRKILDDFFALANFFGGLPKIVPSSRRLNKFCGDTPSIRGDTPSIPEFIESNTLNFRPNFKFSRLKFFGGTPVRLWVCATKASSMSSACKNFRAQHSLRAEI